MSAPPLARAVEGCRWYAVPDLQGNEQKLPSVTTVLNVMAKPALIRWAAKEVATFVADNTPEITALLAKDREAGIDTMKGSPWRKTKKAADIGSTVHAIAEAHVLGRPSALDGLDLGAPEVRGTVQAFLAFLQEWEPEFLATEMTVANFAVGYAGTLDAIFALDGVPLICDYKSGKGVYAEAALQLAAYRHADAGILPNGQHVPIPAVDGGVVLHLRPDGYKLIPVRCDEVVFEAFAWCHGLWRYGQETAPNVLGAAATRVQQPTLAVVD